MSDPHTKEHLDPISTAQSTTSKTNQQALDKVQNQALHLITGVMQSTPITEMKRLRSSTSRSKEGRQDSDAGMPWKPGRRVSLKTG